MAQQNLNPLNAALNPKTTRNTIFGRMTFDAYYCVLVKGRGKVLFDPQKHSERQRRTAIKIDIQPLSELQLDFDISRKFIAEIEDEGWQLVTLRSLQALGVTDLTALNGSYVEAELEKYGSYVNKRGKKKALTAPKILRIFDTRAECLAAWKSGDPTAQRSNGSHAGSQHAVSMQASTASNASNAGSAGSNGSSRHNGSNTNGRAAAAKLLPAMVRSAVDGDTVDVDKLRTMLSENDMLSYYFDMSSPEVLEEIQRVEAELAPPPF